MFASKRSFTVVSDEYLLAEALDKIKEARKCLQLTKCVHFDRNLQNLVLKAHDLEEGVKREILHK